MRIELDGYSAEITEYCEVPPWRGNIQDCPSEMDFYGYVELSYIISPPSMEGKESYEDILAMVRES